MDHYTIANILINSKRWEAAVEELDIIKMASAGAINFDKQSEETKQEVVAWAKNEIETMPSILSDYLKKCGKDV